MPDDMDWINRRARAVSSDEMAIVASVIAEFFTRSGGKIFSDRLAKEWQKSSLAHAKRVSAGSEGGRTKALKAKEKTPSNAKAMLYQPEPEPEPLKREAKASLKTSRGSRLSSEWFLPVEWGEWALGEGMDREAIRAEADKFKDYWTSRAGPNGIKLDWQATWRNWIRSWKERHHGNGTSSAAPKGGKRIDPALEQIARLAGLGTTSGDGRGGVGGLGEEDGSLWMGARPQ